MADQKTDMEDFKDSKTALLNRMDSHNDEQENLFEALEAELCRLHEALAERDIKISGLTAQRDSISASHLELVNRKEELSAKIHNADMERVVNERAWVQRAETAERLVQNLRDGTELRQLREKLELALRHQDELKAEHNSAGHEIGASYRRHMAELHEREAKIKQCHDVIAELRDQLKQSGYNYTAMVKEKDELQEQINTMKRETPSVEWVERAVKSDRDAHFLEKELKDAIKLVRLLVTYVPPSPKGYETEEAKALRTRIESFFDHHSNMEETCESTKTDSKLQTELKEEREKVDTLDRALVQLHEEYKQMQSQVEVLSEKHDALQKENAALQAKLENNRKISIRGAELLKSAHFWLHEDLIVLLSYGPFGLLSRNTLKISTWCYRD